MRNIALALIAFGLLSGSVLAHNGVEHMRGTVTQLTDKAITVDMQDKMTMTIAIAGDTKFEKSAKPATAKDVKAGDRVVIDYVMKGKEMIAKTVRFGPTASEKSAPPKHPKGAR